jgi:hypothetical protein
MVFDSFTIDRELGGVFDGAGLLRQRSRRRRKSVE